MAMESGRDFLLQWQSGSSLCAGATDPPVANTLKDLKGLWVEETIVQHQRYHSWIERGKYRNTGMTLNGDVQECAQDIRTQDETKGV